MARPEKHEKHGKTPKGQNISGGRLPLDKHSLIVPPSSQASSSRYQFCPLKEDEIRLLVLEEATDLNGAPERYRWRGSLVHRTINDYTVYIAVSYAWGDPQTTFPLPMDNGSATIPVTENLWHFLEQHAENLVGQMLWIDQISINQYDLYEKSHQVQLMARIYENAQQTLIWLGKGDDASNYAFDVIERLDVSWPEWQAVLNVPFEAPRSAIEACLLKRKTTSAIPPFDERLKTLLDIFLKRGWFSRLWVLQEAVLSKDSAFLCGVLRCTSTPMLCGLWVLTRMFHTEASYFMNAVSCASLLKLAREKNQTANLFDLLELTRTGLNCTDARDKVYALISLQSIIPNAIVDYTISAQDVYTFVACHHISTTSSLSAFGEIYQSDSEPLLDLPSWVPNWACSNEAGVVDKQSRFQASKKSLWRPCATESLAVLIVRGNIIDVVDKIEPPSRMAVLATDYDARSTAQAYLGELC